MVLRTSRFGLFYGCRSFPECRASHGAHPDGRPLGTPADAATKRARIRAHEAFDVLWKGGEMKRGAAYRWLAEQMGQDEVHLGELDEDGCARVVEIVEGRTKEHRA